MNACRVSEACLESNCVPYTFAMNDSLKGQASTDETRASLNPGAQLEDLSNAEKAIVAEQSHANAAFIHETIRAEGEAELARSTSSLCLSGFALVS